MVLKKSFQKMNAKGLRLVLSSQEMWDHFEAVPDEKTEATAPESDFWKALRAQRNFKPFTGDHIRRAALMLKEQYKLNSKWQVFRG